MEKVEKILKNSKYRYYEKKIEEAEKDREFCRHDIKHCIDVARLTLLLSYDENVPLDRELVYGAALLHDIGRAESCADHRQRGAKLCVPILMECGYSKEEAEEIASVIKSHGSPPSEDERSFRSLFYRADKLSRNCFACAAEKDCYWESDKKNMTLVM